MCFIQDLRYKKRDFFESLREKLNAHPVDADIKDGHGEEGDNVQEDYGAGRRELK